MSGTQQTPALASHKYLRSTCGVTGIRPGASLPQRTGRGDSCSPGSAGSRLRQGDGSGRKVVRGGHGRVWGGQGVFRGLCGAEREPFRGWGWSARGSWVAVFVPCKGPVVGELGAGAQGQGRPGWGLGRALWATLGTLDVILRAARTPWKVRAGTTATHSGGDGARGGGRGPGGSM